MMLFAAVAFGAFGLIIGSFLNVLVLRKGVMSLWGRSACPSCGKIIEWYDNIPVLSWVLLAARCRHCGSSISVQYPLVEASTAVLFIFVGLATFPLNILSFPYFLVLLAQLVIVSLLIAIAVYDVRHTIIPDAWSYSFAALALLLTLTFPLEASSSKLEALIAGPLTALPLFLLWLVSRGTWMGLGDPKLALGIGWLLGYQVGLIAVFFSFIIGSVVLLPLLAYERLVTQHHFSIHGQVGQRPAGRLSRWFVHMSDYMKSGAGLTMKSEVPFGPFLIASCILFWFAKLYGVSLPLYVLGI